MTDREIIERIENKARELESVLNARILDLEAKLELAESDLEQTTMENDMFRNARQQDSLVTSGSLETTMIRAGLDGAWRMTINFPSPQFCFAPVRTGLATFMFKGGDIQIGSSVPVAVSDTPVTITVDYSYAGYKYVYATKILTIENFGAAITHNGTTFQKALYRFRYNGTTGYAYIDQYPWLNPSLPSIYADQPT